jgi:selenide,water dikinase
MLANVLSQLSVGAAMPSTGRKNKRDRNVLVGADTFDDAGVYRLSAECALVQTVDFFTPIVDDPYAYGQIAATNALSDVYAMGGRPITALNLLGVPADKLDASMIARILRGGADKTAEAKCALIGGHTIRALEPIYGLSVTGIVHPKRILTNARARPGDLLWLTKPLGTGIATTAIKRGLASARLARRVVAVMRQLNTAGAEVAEKKLVKAATDVTGFGLLGHLANICRGSGVGAEVSAGAVPALSPEIHDLIDRDCIPGGTRSNMEAAESIVDWSAAEPPMRVLLCDAQTSGGLLLCVPPDSVSQVRKILEAHGAPVAAHIGRIIKSPSPCIRLMP